MLTSVSFPRRAKPDKYGETKQRFQFMLTETASKEIDKIAKKLGITRSEVLEKAIRGGGLDSIVDEEE